MTQSELDFLNSLRQSSQYIQQHREKTFVVHVTDQIMANLSQLKQFAEDITLLHTLGVKVVITLGASLQINQALKEKNIEWKSHLNCRITSSDMIPVMQATIGQLRSQLEAAFTQASVKRKQPVSIVSGNWVISKPKGVILGTDFQQTGALRKVNHQAINACLDSNQIALLTPLVYSMTGEIFNLNTFEQACAIACALKADKLMIFHPLDSLSFKTQQLSRIELQNSIQDLSQNEQSLLTPLLNVSSEVPRIHILDSRNVSTLLMELFTRDGQGLMIFNDQYHLTRQATFEDIPAILNLISPLIQQGVLVERSKENLELDIDQYYVIERDQTIIACAALKLYDSDSRQAELACLAVSEDYRGQNLGQRLLKHIEQSALELNYTALFLLTTHTNHWFVEQGFSIGKITDLPLEKQKQYSQERQSKILTKLLSIS